VIHLAAEIASQRSEAKIRAANVDGTRRLVEAAKATGGDPKFVFCSTVVTGEANGELLEPGKPLPVETPYGRSKQDGERIVAESGLPHAIVRPSHVYGPGGWYEEEFVKRLRQPGRFAVIGRGDNWWDVVRVEDVATALVDAAEKAPSGAVYHAADDEPIRYYDFIALTAKALGVGPPRRIPAGLARIAAGRHAVTAVTRSARSSNARLKEELGWEPRFPSAEQGVPDAVSGILAA
jgi:nucleoside-diphosphate-sugar epimerase